MRDGFVSELINSPQRERVVDGEGQGREERSRAVGPILGQTSEDEVETEGEALGGVFIRVVEEVGVVVDLD